jgi:hypothetical protein
MVKRLSIFFVFVAFAMLQVHNFITHHHHDEKIEISHHDNSKTDHDSPFNDLTHNSEFGKMLAKPVFDKKVIDKPNLSGGLLFQLYDRLECIKKPPRLYPPGLDPSLHFIFLSPAIPLRAPPAA